MPRSRVAGIITTARQPLARSLRPDEGLAVPGGYAFGTTVECHRLGHSAD
jgi:hypothetical protein